MKAGRILAASIAVMLTAAWAGMARPTVSVHGGSPSIQGTFTPLQKGNLNEDPDFPVLVLRNTAQGFPRLLLLVVDARNEQRDAWSLDRDPVVFCLMTGENPAEQRALLDKGFAETGRPSGQFMTSGPEGVDDLLALLVESHERLAQREGPSATTNET